jgi:ketosteroid isomerase-like protein
MTVRTLLAALALALPLGAAVAQGDMDREALRAWVEDQGRTYLDAYAAGDLGPIVAQLADDFRFREIDGTVGQGPEAYAELIEGYLAAGARLSAEGPHHVGYLSETTGFSIWSWEFTAEDGALLAAGESLYLYRADGDGAWRWTMQYNAPVLPAE